jgi:regulator of PEP synthase PpsR (kinase-PPPase family)
MNEPLIAKAGCRETNRINANENNRMSEILMESNDYVPERTKQLRSERLRKTTAKSQNLYTTERTCDEAKGRVTGLINVQMADSFTESSVMSRIQIGMIK